MISTKYDKIFYIDCNKKEENEIFLQMFYSTQTPLALLGFSYYKARHNHKQYDQS